MPGDRPAFVPIREVTFPMLPSLPEGFERRLAVFIDFENLALGFEGGEDASFDIGRVFDRLVEKGKILVKRSYCDWHRFRKYTQELHEAGVELIEIPKRSMTGKNSADIRLVVDAMDLCHGKDHIDTFVIVSGDSDFSPLVAKLKENGKSVIGVGMRGSTSKLLADHCDEFIYYEDIAPADTGAGGGDSKGLPADKREAWLLLFDAIRALQRENYDVLNASHVKDTMKRKRPSFSEQSHGYRSFSDLLEEVQEAGHISLSKDERSGTYVITSLDWGGRRRSRRPSSTSSTPTTAKEQTEQETKTKRTTRTKAPAKAGAKTRRGGRRKLSG